MRWFDGAATGNECQGLPTSLAKGKSIFQYQSGAYFVDLSNYPAAPFTAKELTATNGNGYLYLAWNIGVDNSVFIALSLSVMSATLSTLLL